MGMDISGINPKNKVGEYIRFSIFSWSPMINLVELIAPEEFSKIKYPYTNDGSGLNEEDSIKLGRKLIDLDLKILVEYVESLEEMPQSIRKGKIINTSKFFDPERVKDFGEFLINCGGFRIY